MSMIFNLPIKSKLLVWDMPNHLKWKYMVHYMEPFSWKFVNCEELVRKIHQQWMDWWIFRKSTSQYIVRRTGTGDLSFRQALSLLRWYFRWMFFCNHKNQEGKRMLALSQAVPSHYERLKTLYRVLLTLPISTALLKRGFSELKIIEKRLRTTQGQGRRKSLLLSAVAQCTCCRIVF